MLPKLNLLPNTFIIRASWMKVGKEASREAPMVATTEKGVFKGLQLEFLEPYLHPPTMHTAT